MAVGTRSVKERVGQQIHLIPLRLLQQLQIHRLPHRRGSYRPDTVSPLALRAPVRALEGLSLPLSRPLLTHRGTLPGLPAHGHLWVSFWILPRLFDNVDFLQTLKPFISVSKWEGSAYSVVTRLLILSIFVYYGFHIYSDPNILKENFEITQTIIDDINDWGVSKIKGDKNFSQSALTDYSKLLNETPEQLPLTEQI